LYQATEDDGDARTPRAVALFVLNSHRSSQDAREPEVATRLAGGSFSTFIPRFLDIAADVSRKRINTISKATIDYIQGYHVNIIADDRALAGSDASVPTVLDKLFTGETLK
jgi:DNA replicative helicase MCM subunit Mcm2 (Cdc46/Mcm family)